jgi:hypothetical protein
MTTNGGLNWSGPTFWVPIPPLEKPKAMRVNKRGNDIFPNQEAMRVKREMI